MGLLRRRRIVTQKADGRLALRRAGMDNNALIALLEDYAQKRTQDQDGLERMVFYAQTGSCRWDVLLDYFGHARDTQRCGTCDNCVESPRSTRNRPSRMPRRRPRRPPPCRPPARRPWRLRPVKSCRPSHRQQPTSSFRLQALPCWRCWPQPPPPHRVRARHAGARETLRRRHGERDRIGVDHRGLPGRQRALLSSGVRAQARRRRTAANDAEVAAAMVEPALALRSA
nr:RecQ family zinc-binding domain-containing protein [Paracidovorax cattleyae]